MAKILMRRVSGRLMTLIGGETVLILAAVAFAVYVRLGKEGWEQILRANGVPKALLLAITCQLSLYYADLYDPAILRDRRELCVRLLQAVGGTSLFLAMVYFWVPALIVGRGVFLIAALLVIAGIVLWRLAFEWLSRRVGPRERLLLVGTNAAALELARELYERRELGIEIVGFIDPDRSKVGRSLLNPGIVGTVEDIPAIIHTHRVDRVVLSLADARGLLPMDKLLEMKLSGGVSFDHLASVYEEYTGKVAVENLRPSWLIFSSGFRKSRWVLTFKRVLDITIAATAMILFFPIMLLVAAAIKATSSGPALYHQVRVGQHGRTFTIHKFRSMRRDAEAATGAVWASLGDSRVTLFGRLLRRTRLDEWPQLWNIVRGDMSLVGPRPERPAFVEELARQIPFYKQRHVAKPGLTGWAQIRYTYAATVEDAMEKLQYDLFYIKNMSVALDLFIVVQTIKTVILGKGAC